MKATKKSLLASGVVLLLCMTLLVGTTFAWFTDSVANTGNKITSGELSINAYAYDLGAGGQSFTIAGVNGGQPITFSATAQDLKTDTSPIIEETLWEPGISSAKLLRVENTGSLAAKISLKFQAGGELTGALWFDFIQVENDVTTGAFTRRDMSTLSTFAEDLELPIVKNGDSLEFILVYGMNEDAGNEYQNKSFTASVSVLAAQYTEEEDGFGSNQYDAAATYDDVPLLATAENFVSLLNSAEPGAVIQLTENFNGNINLTDPDVTVDLGGNTLTGKIELQQNTETGTVTFRNGTIRSIGDYSPVVLGSYENGGELTVVLDNLTISNPRSGEHVGGGFLYAIDAYGVHSVVLNQCTVTGSVNLTDVGSAVISGGTYTAVDGNGDTALFYLNSNNLAIDGATLNLNGLKLCDPEDDAPVLTDTTVNK